MKPLHLLIIALMLPVQFTTQARASDRPNDSAIASGILSGHIVPGFAALEATTMQLKQAVEKSCDDSQTLDREPVRIAFRQAMSAWMGVQHIRFGPIMAQDRHYRFQYWPDKHGQGSRQMRRLLSAPITDIPDAGQIAEKSVAIQGFPALEQVLYPSIPPRNDERAKYCRLAEAISGNLAAMSARTLAAWKSYRPEDPHETVATLVRNLTEQLQIISDLKLKRPLGASAKKARPRRAESWRSHGSFKNISRNFTALEALFNGRPDAPGLRAGMAQDGEDGDAAEAIAEHLRYGAAQVERRTQPLSRAVRVQQGRAFAVFLIQHIDATRDLILEYLAPALGVEVGFNAQDGD